MKLQKIILSSAVAGLLTGLTACSSDSDDTESTNNTRYTTGAVTAFGSVYVNNTKYNTDNTTVYIEDSIASESDLRVGMMVTIQESSPGVADTIYHDDDVEGIVLSTNLIGGTGTLNVMGQTVTVDAKTIFESYITGVSSVAGIEAGNIVEVTGSSSGNGSVTATRLELKAVDLDSYLIDHPEGIEVKGIVSTHTDTIKTFEIGALSIDYTNAVLDDMPSGNWDGLYVEAKSNEALNNSGHMVAYKVELENDGSKGHHDDDSEVEVRGEVTEVTSDSITVNGVTYLLNENTRYEHGTIADVTVGALVEVEGYPNNNGDLVAEEVEFEGHDSDSELEIQGNVSVVSTTDDPNVGTIEINGLTIHVNSSTIVHDSSDAKIANFNLSMVGIGDLVKVYYFDDNGTITATKLEREAAAI